ncbi:MAG: magnesium chelatase subunit D [Pseudomonadota bacterium]
MWSRLERALALLAADPVGLGGLWLRARSGPVRDAAVAGLSALPQPLRKVHPTISDEALFGGADLTAMLAEGRMVRRSGLLEQQGTLVLTMAERASSGLAARLAAALDQGQTCLVALDEGANEEEALPAALADRLAFHIDLDALAHGDATALKISQPKVSVDEVLISPDALRDLTAAAVRLGIDSLRAPLLAAKAARAAAALAGRHAVTEDDLREAIDLVFLPRATQVPEQASDEQTPPPPPQDDPQSSEDTPETPDSDGPVQLPEGMLIEAVAAALPADLLAKLAVKARRAKTGASGAGDKRLCNRRGRPLPSRAGRLDGQSRLDLVATLRAAAPWQAARRRAAKIERPLHIRGEDIRLKRYQDRSDRVLVFAVDASGSAAMARLGEAKGAVETLLSQAYASRDHVALIAFRGTTADVLLPPTRSLVQTKRRLGSMAGGGGTPLAAGIQEALTLGLQARSRGMTPTLCLLTDGRANVALDGTGNRSQAAEDAAKLGRLARVQGLAALVIDTGQRPQPALRQLAETMDAPYLPLPRADADRLSTAVQAALDA